MNEHILEGLVVLAGLGALSQLLAWHLRIPSILLLLPFGILAGPVFGVVDPHELLGSATFPLVSLGAAIVLFEGGLSVRWQDLRDVRGPVARLVSIGLVVTWLATTLITHFLVGLSWSLSALLGAILVVTGPTVVGPILRQARPRGAVGRILHFEGVINDPLGAIFALVVFQVIQIEQVETALSLVIWSVIRAVVVSAALAILGGYGFVLFRKRGWIPDSLQNTVLLALVFSVYLLAQNIQAESGLLAVTVLGMYLASQKQVDMERNVDFTEHLRHLIIASLFLVLTARVQWSDLKRLPLEGVAFASLIIFVVRPLTVFVSTIGSNISVREKLFLSAIAPRGVVAAAVASVFSIRLVSAGYQDAEMLMPLSFLVIASCVFVYGFSARPLVSLLGLRRRAPRGLLLLGANPIARALAEALEKQDVPVTMVDTSRTRVLLARNLGLRAEYGRLDAEHIFNRLHLQDVRHFVALTSSHDANGLAVSHMRSVLGPKRVWQVNCEPRSEGGTGTTLVQPGGTFGAGHSYDELLYKLRRGAVRVTPLSEQFRYEEWKEHHGQTAIPLLCIDGEGICRILGPDESAPGPTDRLVSIVPESSDKQSIRDSLSDAA